MLCDRGLLSNSREPTSAPSIARSASIVLRRNSSSSARIVVESSSEGRFVQFQSYLRIRHRPSELSGARRAFHVLARPPDGELAAQFTPGKGRDFSDATPGFIGEADAWTSLSGANSAPSPASWPVPVRRLVVLTPPSFPPGLATGQLLSSDASIFIRYLVSRTSPPVSSLPCRAHTKRHGQLRGFAPPCLILDVRLLCIFQANHSGGLGGSLVRGFSSWEPSSQALLRGG